jgi:hypothetical protein
MFIIFRILFFCFYFGGLVVTYVYLFLKADKKGGTSVGHSIYTSAVCLRLYGRSVGYLFITAAAGEGGGYIL